MSACALFLLYVLGVASFHQKDGMLRTKPSEYLPNRKSPQVAGVYMVGGCEKKVDKVGESCQNSRVDG